ncbi:MAG TPA: hemolysin family protein [Streptosporangiaceae bacterium]|nr:hemolysin family protein [Streptosporangiaceae bacterium]
MGWLIIAAILATVLAALCEMGDAALARVVRPLAAADLAQQPAAGDRQGPDQSASLLADLPDYLSALMLLRAITETAATVLVTVAFVRWLGAGWRAFLSAGAVMVPVGYLVIGVAPRALGRRYAERVAPAAIRLLRPLARLLRPLYALAVAIVGALTPGGKSRDSGAASEAELRGLVDLLERRQVIEPGERKMLHSVVEFSDTLVREVMVPRTDMVFIERDKTLRQALSLALRSGFSRIPVVGENADDVIGIAYLKDIVARGQENHDGESVEKVESIMRPATYVPDSKPIDELLREMQARQIHVAIVIDEYGGTAGLATIEDILEEIVGEIADEYDQEQPTVEWLTEDSARVTSRLPVDELAALFGVDIEAEDVETAGGLLAHALGRVPIAGSVVTVAGLRLTAENVAGRRNRIGTVLVQRAGPAPARSGRSGDTRDNERSGAGPPAGATARPRNASGPISPEAAPPPH